MNAIHPYAVIVGNVGQVWAGNNPVEAQKQYSEWIAEAKGETGRAAGETVTLTRNGEPLREFDPSAGFYFVEMTDTFGGDANYSWCNRFKVRANTVIGAIRKTAQETGHSGRIRKDFDSGELTRYNVSGAAICYFVEHWDKDRHEGYMHVKAL